MIEDNKEVEKPQLKDDDDNILESMKKALHSKDIYKKWEEKE